jgi:hypothetical protein
MRIRKFSGDHISKVRKLLRLRLEEPQGPSNVMADVIVRK